MAPEFHRLAFSRAVEQDLLTDYKVVVLTFSEQIAEAPLQSHLASDERRDPIPITWMGSPRPFSTRTETRATSASAIASVEVVDAVWSALPEDMPHPLDPIISDWCKRSTRDARVPEPEAEAHVSPPPAGRPTARAVLRLILCVKPSSRPHRVDRRSRGRRLTTDNGYYPGHEPQRHDTRHHRHPRRAGRRRSAPRVRGRVRARSEHPQGLRVGLVRVAALGARPGPPGAPRTTGRRGRLPAKRATPPGRRRPRSALHARPSPRSTR